jgi:hypothetical protein
LYAARGLHSGKQPGRRMDGLKEDRRTKGHKKGQTNRWTNELVDTQTNGWTDRKTYVCTERQRNRRTLN